MQVEIVKDINACKELWHRFCPKKMVWNEWEVCLCFLDGHEPYFLHIKKDDQEGLLPLWYDSELKAYRQFGGTYPENRQFWFPETWLDELLPHIPKPLAFYDMNHESCGRAMQNSTLKDKFKPEGFRYILPIEKHQKVDSFLATFSKKHRYNLLSDINKCKSKYRFEWSQEYDPVLEEFNRIRFGQESNYSDEEFVRQFRKLIEYVTEKEMLITLKVFEGDKLIGIEIAIRFDSTYLLLNGGYATEYKNVGKYLIYLHILKAFEDGYKEMDFLTGEGGWKELWNLDKEQYYTFRLE
ncbi:GNAT family N-acetyltransferase [Candidatus Woesearchaeota archaeon]|nr:GNAT family N-acetyltransferase [Candidatus Woesearchaeota archaeon]